MDHDELVARLERIEAKLDQVQTFTAQLQQLFGVWMSGGRGKLVAAAVRMQRGDKR